MQSGQRATGQSRRVPRALRERAVRRSPHQPRLRHQAPHRGGLRQVRRAAHDGGVPCALRGLPPRAEPLDFAAGRHGGPLARLVRVAVLLLRWHAWRPLHRACDLLFQHPAFWLPRRGVCVPAGVAFDLTLSLRHHPALLASSHERQAAPEGCLIL